MRHSFIVRDYLSEISILICAPSSTDACAGREKSGLCFHCVRMRSFRSHDSWENGECHNCRYSRTTAVDQSTTSERLLQTFQSLTVYNPPNPNSSLTNIYFVYATSACCNYPAAHPKLQSIWATWAKQVLITSCNYASWTHFIPPGGVCDHYALMVNYSLYFRICGRSVTPYAFTATIQSLAVVKSDAM